jgi:hypothetical protein
VLDSLPNSVAIRPSRFAATRLVSILVATVLLTAAGLKLYGLNVSPVPRSGFLSSPTVQTVVVAWEILLGIWLLVGTVPALAWLAAATTFLTFAIVSGYYGLIGQANCGCFGAIEASPWHAFGVDLLCLSALLATHPAWSDVTVGLRPTVKRMATVGSGAALILGGLALAGTLVHGSVEASLARLRGQPLGFPEYVDFGTVAAGTMAERSVEITNYSDQPVRLIGGTSDCSCVTTSQMPLTIPAGKSVVVTIRLKTLKGEGGSFTRTVELWSDQPGVKLRLTLACFSNGG